MSTAILWRRLDKPGHEAARLWERDGRWHLDGTAVFLHEGGSCRLEYRVVCDPDWMTRDCRVTGWIGDRVVNLELSRDPSGGWWRDGERCGEMGGCTDIDLGFSPSTNLLPIRRLNLDVAAQAPVRAAWLRFPGLEFEPLEQVYTRLSADRYRYESGGGRFSTELVVENSGLVREYPGFFEVEEGG